MSQRFVEAGAGSVRRLLAKNRVAVAARRAVHLGSGLAEVGGVCLTSKNDQFWVQGNLSARLHLCIGPGAVCRPAGVREDTTIVSIAN